MRIAIALLIGVIIPFPCFAREQAAGKLQRARAAAVAMVQPSGPLRIDSGLASTPEAWRAQPRIVGTYSNYSNRNTFVLPFAPWSCGYGYGGGGYGFGSWGGGWYPLGGYSCGYSGW